MKKIDHCKQCLQLTISNEEIKTKPLKLIEISKIFNTNGAFSFNSLLYLEEE